MSLKVNPSGRPAKATVATKFSESDSCKMLQKTMTIFILLDWLLLGR